MTSHSLVIVGMSGGVDSSVAAWLLLQQGYEVQGLFMSNWDEDEDGYCTAAQDYQDARRVCEQLGIDLHKVSFAGEYRERVFAYFLEEYRAGRTPNPDVLCNREIKFGVCFDYARRLGADYVATGHYARVTHTPMVRLLKGVDPQKDQSYFLHAMPSSALVRTLFPIGEMQKDEVRRIARDLTLPVFDKKDSTGICFIGERPFAEFLSRYLPAQPGSIETLEGQVIGRHQGLMYYTLGQRQGLRIGGRNDAGDEPWYVARKDLGRNVLLVAQGHDHPALFANTMKVSQLTWVSDRPTTDRFRCSAKVRYRQVDQACTVAIGTGNECVVEFDHPQRAVTPGQYAVFYADEQCLGGGVIESSGGGDAQDLAADMRAPVSHAVR
jgi:tRNA-uridine 2-sulfurtransferase